MKNFVLFLFLLLQNIAISYPQDFGDVSTDELKMKKFDADPGADAVILFDKGVVRITRDFKLEVKRHVRIKILTEAGKKYADREITYWHEDDLDGLDASSYTLKGGERELNDNNIFEVISGKFKNVTLKIPGVEVGSVIEYRYEILSDYISNLEPWFFQGELYTKLSQLKVLIPKGFTFSKLNKNIELYNITEKVDNIMDPDNVRKKITEYTWTGKNIPGIRNEPYLDNIEDQYATMVFILQTYRSNYVNYTLAKTWNSIAKRISRVYDKLIEEDGLTNTTLQNIIKTETDPLKKAKRIYNYVRTNIKTTKHKTLYGSNFKNPNEVIELKSGSSSEKNMLLINLLNKAGLNAKPLLISTRAHGEIIKDFCEPNQFNRLICLLRINNRSYFLYTGLKANPFSYLTPATDVDYGFLINNDKGSIINLNPKIPYNRKDINTDGNIGNDGLITATTTIVYKGYFALVQRDILEDLKAEKHVKKILKNLYIESKLDTFYYADIDSIDKPVTLTIKYNLPDYLDETDNLVYFSPPLFTSKKKNLFISETRKYSIDFAFKNITVEKLKLYLPNNMTVSDVPIRKKAEISEYNYNMYNYLGKDYIECTRIINLKQRKIQHYKYSKLKSLFDDIVASDQEQFVLNKHNNTDANITKQQQEVK